jgi:hypothetical protein
MSMGKSDDKYRANAQECERMAGTARNERDKQDWHDMAEDWLRMIEPTGTGQADSPGAC